MRQLLAAAAALLLAAGMAAAADTTISRADITASGQVSRELACWDRNTSGVTVWGYYDAGGDKLVLELLQPQLVAAGRSLVLRFTAADLAMGEQPLSHVRVVYGTSEAKC